MRQARRDGLEASLITRVVAVLKSSTSDKTKAEALHAIQNICDSNDEAALKSLVATDVVAQMQASLGYVSLSQTTCTSAAASSSSSSVLAGTPPSKPFSKPASCVVES